MKCTKCESENVGIGVIQTGMKTCMCERGVLWVFIRIMLIIYTGGLWLLIGKGGGKAINKAINKTTAICQNCGHTWPV